MFCKLCSFVYKMSIILKQSVFIFRLKTLFEITYYILADGIFRHWAVKRLKEIMETCGQRKNPTHIVVIISEAVKVISLMV